MGRAGYRSATASVHPLRATPCDPARSNGLWRVPEGVESGTECGSRQTAVGRRRCAPRGRRRLAVDYEATEVSCDPRPGASCAEPPRGGPESVPETPRRRPGRLVRVDRRGVREGPSPGPPGLPLFRLRGVPLVPRHAAGIVPRRGHRETAQRAVRRGQGRSRTATRCRRPVHGLRVGRHGFRRLADVGVPHAGPPAAARRHVLPEGAGRPASVVSRGADRRGRGIPHRPRAPHLDSRGGPSLPRRAGGGQADGSDRCLDPGVRGRLRRPLLRRRQRRIRPRPEVPAAASHRVPVRV